MSTATTNTSSSTASKTKTVGKVAESSSAVNASIADTMSHLTGKRMYRMANGQMVELPADMTAEEAAHLEAEGNAAQKKLGKGPGPKPLPNVKEKSKVKKAKGEGKEKQHGKKGGHDKKGEGKSKGGGAHAGKVGAIKGKVGAWLMAKGAPAIARGQAKLQVLKNNEHTHDDAGVKLSQTEKAVVPPSMEGQSTSNAGQVETVEAKPAPQPSEAVAKQALTQAIQDNIPQSIEDVDNFKSNNKAGQMSAAVSVTINKDKNEVAGTFEDMKKDPPPAKSDVKPETLPPEEVAPATAKMNLGTDTIAPLQKEHTDVSNYTKEADSKLKEEGVSQEQLDMVDSGDLAEANKEKKGMEKKAKTEPQAITQFAQQANKKVDTELQQEENKGRDEIKNQRKQKLNATKQKQQGTKTLIEKKREEVANQINNIYKRAQDKVTKKLADLETIAMQRFDDGNAKATKEFEDNVNRQIDAFKDRRYSGFWGWAKKAKDWLLGMDDLPEVKAIFDNNRTVFVTKVNALVDLITQDNKKVIQECKDELTNARKEIKAFVDKLGPDLKDAGKKAQDEMSSKLDELDKFVNKKEEELQNKLQDKQKAAIKAIDEKIEKMKEAMSGALSKLGKLLLLAAKKFFSWALEKFGFSLAEIDSIINKGAAVLKAIFTQPIQFVKNLMNAAILGFQNFGKNFLKHLKDALFEWLTGSLEGLTLPKVWDFQGIISVGLQMIGISYQNIRKHMVTVMGENVVSGLEKTFTLVKTLITDGPMAAWEQLKEMAGEMRDAFIDAVKDFIKTKIIEQAIQWVVSLFVPGAGIIKAIIGIYDTIVFFINKAKQIMQMISNFLGSISEIAAGNIGAAADAMENGLARGLSLVINFLAQLLHLNGITDKIRNAIQKIRAKVDNVLLKVAQWIADKAKKLWGNVKAGAASVAGWLGIKKPFQNPAGESHTLFMKDNSGKGALMIHSTEMSIENYLRDLEEKNKDNPDALKNINKAQGIVSQVIALTAVEVKNPDDAQKIDKLISQLASLLEKISPNSKKLEGALALYRGLHWWIEKSELEALQRTGSTDEPQDKRQGKSFVETETLSDAVIDILKKQGLEVGQDAAATAQAVKIVKGELKALNNNQTFTAKSGADYGDRFYYLLSRFVSKQKAVEDRLESGARVRTLWTDVVELENKINAAKQNNDDKSASVSHSLKKKALDEIKNEMSGNDDVYYHYLNKITKKPFISTSKDALQASRYSVADKFTRDGFVARKGGEVGKVLIYVFPLKDLARQNALNVEALEGQGKVVISKQIKEMEITFTANIPPNFLRTELAAVATDAPAELAKRSEQRAKTEATKDGGLKDW